MNRIIWLFVGLLLGAGGVWTYYTSVAMPQLETQVEVATKEKFEQSQTEKQMFVTATITEISGTVIEAMTEKDDREASISIQTGAGTKFFAQQNDEESSKMPILFSELAPGSIITVVTSGIIDLTQPINAAEIIKL